MAYSANYSALAVRPVYLSVGKLITGLPNRSRVVSVSLPVYWCRSFHFRWPLSYLKRTCGWYIGCFIVTNRYRTSHSKMNVILTGKSAISFGYFIIFHKSLKIVYCGKLSWNWNALRLITAWVDAVFPVVTLSESFWRQWATCLVIGM